MNDKIYPSMVIRSQAEAIELLEKENAKLKEENERYRKLGFKYLNEQNEKLKHILDELEKWAEEGDKESLHIPYECELDYVDVLDEIKELRGRENE